MRLGLGLGLWAAGQGGGDAPFTPAALDSALIEWWDFRTSANLTLGGGNAVSNANGEVNGLDLFQATGSLQPIWNASGFISFDASNDYLQLTLASPVAQGQMYIQTVAGWYKSGVGNWTAVTHRFNSANVQQVVFVNAAAMTAGNIADLEAYLGVDEYWFITKTLDLTISNRIDNNPNIDYTLDYLGANAASFSAASSQAGATVNVGAQGLTAPVRMRWPTGIGDDTTMTVLRFEGNSLTGVVPSAASNVALTTIVTHTNQLTGVFPSLASNVALAILQAQINQLTGSVPSLASNVALVMFQVNNNQLTGYEGGGVSATLLTFRAENNLLTQSAVDAILADFVAAGANNGTLNVGGSGNAAPSAAGITDRTTLISRGWTVTTN